MVFLIQNTQNRDNDILHLKIDELIRATKEAQNASLCLDKMGTRELRKLREQYSSLGEEGQINFDSVEEDNALQDGMPPPSTSTDPNQSELTG
jgi:low affinity Fe/Cu permease